MNITLVNNIPHHLYQHDDWVLSRLRRRVLKAITDKKYCEMQCLGFLRRNAKDIANKINPEGYLEAVSLLSRYIAVAILLYKGLYDYAKAKNLPDGLAEEYKNTARMFTNDPT